MQAAEAILNAFFLITAIVVIAHGIRMLWFAGLRNFGLWNPEDFHKWVIIPWREIAEQYVKYREWRVDEFDSGGKATSAWGGLWGRLVLVFKPGDMLLGGFGYYGFRLFQPLGFRAERHLSMVAGTGTGKTTLMITMLGLHPGNAFVIDPKGQITTVIANRRGAGGNGVKGMGKDVAILDPNSIIKGHKRASWNAIDELARVEAREGPDAVVRYAKKMAEGLVVLTPGEKPYFPKTARSFIFCLILHVYTTEPQEKRTMLRVRELLTRGLADELKAVGASVEEVQEKSFKALLHEMQENPALNGVVAKGAATLSETGRSYGDILSTAREAMSFYDLPEIANISGHSDFSLEDLKLGNLDLFICAPTGDIRDTYSGWFRLLTVIALDLFEQIPGNLEEPCLFAVDEMPSLGYIEKIATTAPTMRSYGVRLLAITQNLEKLQKAYPQDWRGFLGDSDVTYWMGTNEKATGEFLSEYLGKWTHIRRRYSKWIFWRWWRLWWATGDIVSEKDRDLLTPQQAMKILAPLKENMILTRFGKSPLRVKTMPYFKELPVYFYDADPEHREHPARASMRKSIIKSGGLPWESGEDWGLPHIAPTEIPEARPEERESDKPAASKPKTDAPSVVEREAIKPVTPPIDLTLADALALFGISGEYTLNELDLRKSLLLKQSSQDEDHIRRVNKAYDMLATPLNFQKAANG